MDRLQAYTGISTQGGVQLASSVSLVPGFEEGVGFMPDYWIDSADPVGEVVRWLNNPDTYRFRLRNAVET